ncbi:MAG: hypothetical protein ACI9HK_000974, partial [Pirellulaceae bacterium]
SVMSDVSHLVANRSVISNDCWEVRRRIILAEGLAVH